MPMARYRLAIFGPLALAGCAIMPRPADPQIVLLADAIHSEAGIFFAGLAARQAPDCAFQANAGAYDHLGMLAGQLKNHISGNHGSPALVQASEALARTIGDARASHEAASATAGDINGICMAPGAIALNADAIARASVAIGDTQKAAGEQ